MSPAEEVCEHLASCAMIDAAFVQLAGSADETVQVLLNEGWTWDERPTEYVAGKRLRYLRAPGALDEQ